MFKLIAATVVFVSASAVAQAADGEPNTWRVMKSSDAGQIQSIVSGSDTVPGTMFRCSGDRLTVAIALEPGDLAATLEQTTTRTRQHDAETQFGDGDAFESDWFYLPALKVAFAKDELTAKKFYNAAVRAESISWKMERKSPMTVTLPEMNDVFKSFANDCSVTNPDK